MQLDDLLKKLAETATDEFDQDRGIHSRQLYRCFKDVVNEETVCNLDMTDREKLTQLLDMLDKFVNYPEWELNNKELLRDEYNYFVRSGGRQDF